MSLENHPLDALKHLVEMNPGIEWDRAFVDFKVYQRPHLSSDMDPQNRPGYYERKTVQVAVLRALDVKAIMELGLLCGVRMGEDISMGNKIHIASSHSDGLDFWYPQMDFQTSAVSRNALLPNMDVVEQSECDMAIYTSGRSYHGYGTRLRTYAAWVEYMGRMLLLNNPTRPDVVDPRWIGKSLAVGQSYLRMTAESDQYLKVPEFQYVIRPVAAMPVEF